MVSVRAVSLEADSVGAAAAAGSLSFSCLIDPKKNCLKQSSLQVFINNWRLPELQESNKTE